MRAIHIWFSDIMERHPMVGYVSASTTASAGVWAIVDGLTHLAGLISVGLGIAIGVYTLRIQRRTWNNGGKSNEQ